MKNCEKRVLNILTAGDDWKSGRAEGESGDGHWKNRPVEGKSSVNCGQDIIQQVRFVDGYSKERSRETGGVTSRGP